MRNNNKQFLIGDNVLINLLITKGLITEEEIKEENDRLLKLEKEKKQREHEQKNRKFWESVNDGTYGKDTSHR